MCSAELQLLGLHDNGTGSRYSGWGIRRSNPGTGKTFFSSPEHPHLPGREADHSPPSSAKIKNVTSYTSTSAIRLHGEGTISHIREKQRVRAFNGRVLREIFGPTGHKATGESKKIVKCGAS